MQYRDAIQGCNTGMQYVHYIAGRNKVMGSLDNVISPAVCIASQLRHVNEERCNLLNFLNEIKYLLTI